MANPFQRSRVQYRRAALKLSLCAAIAVFGIRSSSSTAGAAERPPLQPDAASPLTTASHISAAVEFGLPALAAAIQRDIPKRLATFDERVSCVHRRVFAFRVNANCDVRGFIERTSGVLLYGRGDRVFGAVSIHGAAEGQGANRFTARIHGETEASATVEAEARPQLRKDWSLELNFSDRFHWSEPPYLHVLGRDIALASYVEPKIRAQLGRIRSRALAEAQRLDLHDKAARAWRHAFEPIKLADDPQVWLQLIPQSAAFAGVRANSKVLSGSLEFSGEAETFVGQQPPAVTATNLPELGAEVPALGTFDVILPLRIGYDTIKDKISQAIAAAAPHEVTIRDVEVYPSSGKLVIALRVASASDADKGADEWVYFSAAPKIDGDAKTVRLPDLDVSATTGEARIGSAAQQIVTQLREAANFDFGISWDNLLMAANERLKRPLKDGFRMEGHLTSAKLEKVLLLSDGIAIALRASGELRILYGL
jgi:hypothetical protein